MSRSNVDGAVLFIFNLQLDQMLKDRKELILRLTYLWRRRSDCLHHLDVVQLSLLSIALVREVAQIVVVRLLGLRVRLLHEV